MENHHFYQVNQQFLVIWSSQATPRIIVRKKLADVREPQGTCYMTAVIGIIIYMGGRLGIGDIINKKNMDIYIYIAVYIYYICIYDYNIYIYIYIQI